MRTFRWPGAAGLWIFILISGAGARAAGEASAAPAATQIPAPASAAQPPAASPSQTGTPAPVESATPAQQGNIEPNPVDQRPIQIPEIPSVQNSREQVAYLLRARRTAAVIKDLVIADAAVPIIMIAKGNDIKPTIGIRGAYTRPGWRLLAQGGGEALPPEFTIFAHLQGRVNEIQLVAVGPGGARETEKIYVYSPNARVYHVVSPWEDILFSTGVALFSYGQSGFGLYESLNAIASLRYSTPDNDSLLGFHAGGSMTVWGIATTPIATSPQFFEGNGDFSLRLNKSPLARTRFRALLGATYLTMFSNGSPFGFSDFVVPEIGIYGRYIANAKDDWLAEFRYMPLNGFEDFGQWGLNMSFGVSRLLKNSRRAELALCYTTYQWIPISPISIETSLLTVRLGITL